MHPNAKVIWDCLKTVYRDGEETTGGDVISDGADRGLLDLVTDDFIAHVPGRHQLSGTYYGKEEAIEKWLTRLLQLTDGTLHVEVHDVMANDNYAVGIYTYSAKRNGKSCSWRSTSVYRIRDGKMAEEWMNHVEQHELDEFLA